MFPRTLNCTRRFLALAALGALAVPMSGLAQDAPIRIAHIYSRTGPLEAYGQQTARGMALGLEFATNGTMMVAGRRLVVIEKDDQGKPDVGKSLLWAAYADDKADIAVGASSSNVALALLPVAEEARKVLVVEPAVADAITGERWNRYVFRTGHNSTMAAVANGAALDKPGISIATLAQDYAYGRDGVKAFRQSLKNARIVHEEYLPINASDFTAGAQRMIDALKSLPGRKIIWINWAGAGNPYKIAELHLERYGIEIAGVGNMFSAMAPFKNLPGMEGGTYYYYGIPKNRINDWLIDAHQKRYGTPPDFFTAGGMNAAIAIVTALNRTQGKTDAESLIAAMEGMGFDTPKGRMTFRKEDHQAMQSMYHFRIKADPALAWGVPELVREIRPEEMDVPIRNRR